MTWEQLAGTTACLNASRVCCSWGGGMLFGSLQLLLCAVKGRTCSLEQQALWMPWVRAVGIIDPDWKQHKDEGKYVKTCLDHAQTEGSSRETAQVTHFMLSCLNKQKDLTF